MLSSHLHHVWRLATATRLAALLLAGLLCTSASAGHYTFPQDQRFESSDNWEYQVHWVKYAWPNGMEEEPVYVTFTKHGYDYEGEQPPESGNHVYDYGGALVFPAGGAQIPGLLGIIERKTIFQQEFQPIPTGDTLQPEWHP